MDKKVFRNELLKIVEISKEFGVKKVMLFGSCLEDIRTANDIDIAVSGVNPRDFFKYYGKLSMATRNEIDLIDLNDARPHLHNRILTTGKIIYEK